VQAGPPAGRALAAARGGRVGGTCTPHRVLRARARRAPRRADARRPTDRRRARSRAGAARAQRRSRVLRKELRCAFVACRAPRRRQLVVDRRAHDRVDELQRVPVAQDRHRGQGVRGLRGDLAVELGKRRGVAQLGALAEHRDGTRELVGGATHPPQTGGRRARDRLRRDLLDAACGRVLGDDAVGLEDPQQLLQQERVAARRDVTGTRKLLRARTGKLLFDEHHRRRLAEKARAQHGADKRGLRDRGQPLARTLTDTGGVDDQDRELADAAREIRQERDRRIVGPMGVVDRDQQRLLDRQICRQPVQAVQDRAGIRAGTARRRGGRQDRRCEARGIRQPALAIAPVRRRQRALEELAYDAVRELALELAAARSQHTHAGNVRRLTRMSQQRCLANPCLALDRNDRPLPVNGRGDGVLELLELARALEQRDGRPRSSALHRGPDSRGGPHESPVSPHVDRARRTGARSQHPTPWPRSLNERRMHP